MSYPSSESHVPSSAAAAGGSGGGGGGGGGLICDIVSDWAMIDGQCTAAGNGFVRTPPPPSNTGSTIPRTAVDISPLRHLGMTTTTTDDASTTNIDCTCDVIKTSSFLLAAKNSSSCGGGGFRPKSHHLYECPQLSSS